MSNTFHCEIHIKTDIKDHKVEVELKNAYRESVNKNLNQHVILEKKQIIDVVHSILSVIFGVFFSNNRLSGAPFDGLNML